MSHRRNRTKTKPLARRDSVPSDSTGIRSGCSGFAIVPQRRVMPSSFPALAGMAAGALSLLAFVPYIIAILRGQTRPNRVTWWIWATTGAVLLASYHFSGADTTIWVPASYFVASLATALLSIRYGEGGATPLDRGCLLGAGAGLLLWWWFDAPVVALVTTLGVDFAGAVPTIRKAWIAPHTEDRLAWALFLAGNALNLIAVDRWEFAIAVYPVYFLLASGTISLLVLRPRPKLVHTSPE